MNAIVLLVGVFGILMLAFFKIKFKKFPGPLVMLVFTSIFVYFLNLVIPAKDLKVPILLSMGMQEVPKIKMVFPFMDFKYIHIMFFPSLAVAMLSILEVSSITKGISARSGQKIRSNQDIFGVGIANLVLSFFHFAMPSSASVSRSTLNYNSSGKTRFASVMSGVIAAALLYFFWPLVKHIPLCALAAFLIVMVISVVDIRHVKLCFRTNVEDAIVFSLTMLGCLVFRLDIAFFLGIVISIIFYLRRAAVPNFVEYDFNKSGNLVVISPKRFSHKNIRIIGIAGDLFFATVDLVQNTLQRVIKEPDLQVIILRLKNIYHVDASVCLAILKLNDFLTATGRYLLISGVTPEVWQIFEKAGIIKQLGKSKIFTTSEEQPQVSTKKAFTTAERLISK